MCVLEKVREESKEGVCWHAGDKNQGVKNEKNVRALAKEGAEGQKGGG